LPHGDANVMDAAHAAAVRLSALLLVRGHSPSPVRFGARRALQTAPARLTCFAQPSESVHLYQYAFDETVARPCRCVKTPRSLRTTNDQAERLPSG
jgi:hypothetical protein